LTKEGKQIAEEKAKRNPQAWEELRQAVELYLNRRMQSFTALKSWTGNVFTAFNS